MIVFLAIEEYVGLGTFLAEKIRAVRCRNDLNPEFFCQILKDAPELCLGRRMQEALGLLNDKYWSDLGS